MSDSLKQYFLLALDLLCLLVRALDQHKYRLSLSELSDFEDELITFFDNVNKRIILIPTVKKICKGHELKIFDDLLGHGTEVIVSGRNGAVTFGLALEKLKSPMLRMGTKCRWA